MTGVHTGPMSRTRRRKWEPRSLAEPGPYFHYCLTVGREKTCKPACGVCDKPYKREDRRRQRHDQRRAIAEDATA